VTTTAGNQSLDVIEEHWDITYSHAVGAVAARFFEKLRDDAILTAARCPDCRRALLPPRGYCDRCFVLTTDAVPVGTTGTLEAFTIVNQSFKGLPAAPYCFGYVLLDGADTAILNYIRGIDFSDVDGAAAVLIKKPAMRVAFAESRVGRMSDFWFEVADDPT